MQAIIAPIKHQDTGPQVVNLIECLLFLVGRGVVKTVAAPNKPTKEELDALAAAAQQELATPTVGKASLRLVLYLQLQEGLGDGLKGAVDDKTAEMLNGLLRVNGAVFDEPDLWIVEGVVRQGDAPVAGAMVNVFDRDLRLRQPLGVEVKTDANGHYLVTFSTKDFQRGDRKQRPTPWLIVEARANDTAPLVKVEKREGVQQRVTIDVQLGARAPTEWEAVTTTVLPLLEGQIDRFIGTHAEPANLPPSEVTPADLDFLEAETGLAREILQAWVISSQQLQESVRRLGDEHPSEGKIVGSHGWPLFYGLARSRPGITLDEILNLGAEQWTRSRRSEESANRIPVVDEAAWKQLSTALQLLADLRHLDPAHALADPFAGLLVTAPAALPRVVALDALAIYREDGLDASAFETLAVKHPGDAKAIRGFARAVRLHELVDGDLSLVKELDARIDEDTASTEPLARLSTNDWMGVVTRASSSQADVASVSAKTYGLQAKVEVEHPLPALAARVKQGTLGFQSPEMKGLEKHLDKYPHAIAALLNGTTDAPDVDTLPKAVQKTVRNLGRFSRTGLTYEIATDLINLDIDTPATANGLGGDVIGGMLENKYDRYKREAIEQFVDKTQLIATGATGLISHLVGGKLSPALFGGSRAPVPDIVRENLPTLRGFFGDLDECICRPCESVLGPPAYLVDLLNLLKKVPAGASPEGALSVLRERRPDIFDLGLTCENAETELPYIDLVLEVLESAVGPQRHQTGNRNLLAYERLARQLYPWTLPFDLAHAETTAFLDRLRLSRAELIRLQAGPSSDHLAAATLTIGMPQQGASANSESEWQLITAGRSGAEIWKAWGLTPSPISALSRVSVLLDRAFLDLDTLDLLVATRFVTASSGAPLNITGRDQCKTSEMTIEGLTEAHLDRIHRFVRLLKKLPGWNVTTLDTAIAVYGGGDITAATLSQVSGLDRVARRLRLPMSAVTSSSPIRTDTVGRALGITPRQAGLVGTLIGIDSFDGLSRVERIETFCDAVDLVRESAVSVEDTAYALLPFDALPAWGVRPSSARKTDAVVEARLKDLQTALRTANSDEASTPEPDLAEALSHWMEPAQARYVVDSIERSVFGLARGQAPDANGITVLYRSPAGTPRRLGGASPLFDGPTAERLLTIVPSSPRTADEVEARKEQLQLRHRIVRDRIAERWPERLREQRLLDTVASWTGWPLPLVSDALTSYLRIDDGRQGAVASDILLSADFWGGTPGPRVDTSTAPRLHDWIHRLDRMTVLASTLGIPAELWPLLASVSVNGATGIDWRDLLAPTRAPSGATWQARWREWRALISLVQLSGDGQVSLPTIQALFSRIGTGSGAVTAQTLEPLALRLSVSNEEALAIAQRAIGNPTTGAGLRDPIALKRLLALARTLEKVRASTAQYAGLIDCANNAPAALTARLLLESTTEPTAWPATLAAVNDTLRGQQRDALSAHLVHRDSLGSVNELYERYLIDTQMEPCMQTTRIGQAIAAVQLFAQRILFGSEPGVNVPADRPGGGSSLRRDWPWMRNYRVWEANRRVFLYPENWLFPELRDDKSSSFKQLESALGQSELTQDVAGQSFGQFLDDVARIGQTQVLGMFEDANDDRSRRILYIVGRSANPPYLYFWRQCVDFGSAVMEWSPWQRIELDIQGDHVLPFVLAGELYVAWPVFKRSNEGSSQTRKWEIRLSWSRYDGRSWLRQEISRDAREIDIEPFRDEREGFAFRVESSRSPQQGVSVRCFAAQRPAGSTWEPPVTSSDSHPWTDGSHAAMTARYWIRLYRDNGTDAAWMELDPAKSDIRLVNVDGNVPLDPSAYSWPMASNGALAYSDHEINANLEASVVLRGQRYFFQKEVIDVPAQTIKNFSLHFKLDQQLQAADVGLTIESAEGFACAAIFTLDTLQEVQVSAGAGDLTSPVAHTRPWMNGLLQVGDAGGVTLSESVIFATRETTLFATTAEPVYWLLGSGSRRSQLTIPDVWYFEEGGARCYLDIATPDRPRFSGFRLFPDSFRESREFAAEWRERSTIENPLLQNVTFDSGQMPTPTVAVATDTWLPALAGNLAFDGRMPYACYNWEVFFHAPLLIADQLSKQHKFEDAERWLRYVFDPTSGDPGGDAKRFLKFRVFREPEISDTVTQELAVLAQVAAGHAPPEADDAIANLIERWRDTPFRPFLIARRRHVAFLWRTLFAYLDNLIAWADSLYRRDTRESINEATQLYVLAARILGPRPKLTTGTSQKPGKTYADFASEWDDFANHWFDATAQPARQRRFMAADDLRPVEQNAEPQASPQGYLMFCIPFNDKLFTYWNTVEERLVNIRHCRNIQGITRDLPLTDAPIDPELLVRATAAGLDLGDVISGLYAPPPHYRYGILAARAADLANEAKALGAAMLSAIEKRDAEQLSQLRSSNEISLLRLVRDVRTLQITEAERNLDALRASRKSVGTRYSQYQRLLGKTDVQVPDEQQSAGEESMLGGTDSGLASNRSKWGLIKEENEQYVGFDGANTFSIAAGISEAIAGSGHAAASIVRLTIGGELSYEILQALADSASAFGKGFSVASQAWRTHAEQQGMMASHIRRRDEWAFQSNQTLKELQQVDKQILANEIRIQITRKELDNHIEQIEQARAVDEVMRNKFSNEQLYEWMKSQLSGLYFTTYRMALEMARNAEKAAARELGVKPLGVLRNDYWDSLRAGLLAGERLHQDIKRLDIAFLDQNRREYELTKHVSLRRLDPRALLQLRHGSNRCEFEIPEWLFDLDTPGHYMRRIKSVSISVPCVVGPYSNVSGTLTLLRSTVRHSSDATPGYGRPEQADDPRFTDYFSAAESVVTSSANADSGLFETQLRDERFLPFEGQGVESRWRFELPGDYRQFDYSTISDVVLTIRYTARDAGDKLRRVATAAVPQFGEPPNAARPTLPVLLTARADFPSAWASPGPMVLTIGREFLPYWMDAAHLEIKDELTYVDVVKGQSGLPRSSNPVTRAGDVWTLPAKAGDAVDRVLLLAVAAP